MADETNAKGSGWTDREKLTYIIGLIENSRAKLDHKDTPRPPGRTPGACLLMMVRLKSSVKKELEAWKDGEEQTATPEKPKNTTRKRKANDTENDGDVAPKKRAGGRKKKAAEVEYNAKGHVEIKEEFTLANEFN